MNFEFIKNRKIDKKSAFKFNVLTSLSLWFLLLVVGVSIYLFGQFFGFGYDIKKYSICFYFLEVIFAALVYKFLIFKFFNKFFIFLFFVAIPLIMTIGFTSYFWYFITNLNIVGNIQIL